ncbi:MAG: hypothetical protein M3Z96_13420 [Pseudomonadota bacterium]|nr:hypothetical protein [Pseudomonadota bacterium]
MEQFIKPALALWRAGIYFLIGTVLIIIGTIWQPPFSAIVGANRLWYHNLIDKGVGSLDTIAYVVYFAGILYAILIQVGDFLWNSGLQISIENGFRNMADALTIGSAKISYYSVIKWIGGSSETDEKYKSIIMNLFCKCYGAHSADEHSYLNYVVQNLMETHAKDTAITRENLTADITIRKTDNYPDLFQWDEKKDYILKCPAAKGTYPLQTAISIRADTNNVAQLLQLLNLTVKIDKVDCFSFQEWLRNRHINSYGFEIKDENGSLVFDGKWITLNFSKTVEIVKRETPISILESSFITRDERAYHLVVQEPTYNVALSMKLEGLPTWYLQKPLIGASWYHSGATNFADIDKNNPRWVSAKVPRWVLPGIWATVEWASE